ncbi:DUF4097 family beta strand repeat-containing protein [Embleya hyalina]|uniref:DUF4097 domain-containing protein n=1 Tax=Embleya hyalina TaxID=516124 RepID=A0A401YG28_9ACTN|nr:DUF4097 family beta strand repeat-containing protein [Embleya hyalina]GCD93565.1 hypothetical protein EHYA_01209 [Embleya hyalina]
MQTFDTPGPISAVLHIPAGRVQVIAADRTDTTVEVRPVNPAKGRDVEAARRITVEYDDGVLRIAAPKAKAPLVGASGSVEVTVRLPAGSRIEGKAVAAEFRAVGRFGDVVFDGANGAIKLDEVASVRLTALAGDVSVGRLAGSAEISTQKGDIRIHEAARGTVVLRTLMGDVSVGAARGVSAALDAGTSYGRIDNALGNTGVAELHIRATTDHGNIDARSL